MTSTRLQEIEKAHHLLKDYDGSTVTAVAEIWAEENLGMKKAERGNAGYDGTLPDGRALEVKSKKHGANSASATYITLSKSSIQHAESVLIVFVDYDTCQVRRTIGPVSLERLMKVGRTGKKETRYYVAEILTLLPTSEHDIPL